MIGWSFEDTCDILFFVLIIFADHKVFFQPMIEDDVFLTHSYLYIYHYYQLILLNMCDEMFVNLHV